MPMMHLKNHSAAQEGISITETPKAMTGAMPQKIQTITDVRSSNPRMAMHRMIPEIAGIPAEKTAEKTAIVSMTMIVGNLTDIPSFLNARYRINPIRFAALCYRINPIRKALFLIFDTSAPHHD